MFEFSSSGSNLDLRQLREGFISVTSKKDAHYFTRFTNSLEWLCQIAGDFSRDNKHMFAQSQTVHFAVRIRIGQHTPHLIKKTVIQGGRQFLVW